MAYTVVPQGDPVTEATEEAKLAILPTDRDSASVLVANPDPLLSRSKSIYGG
jgi:hypothetical protein